MKRIFLALLVSCSLASGRVFAGTGKILNSSDGLAYQVTGIKISSTARDDKAESNFLLSVTGVALKDGAMATFSIWIVSYGEGSTINHDVKNGASITCFEPKKDQRGSICTDFNVLFN